MPALYLWKFDCDFEGVYGTTLIGSHHELRGPGGDEGKLICTVIHPDHTQQAILRWTSGRLPVDADQWRYVIIRQRLNNTGAPSQDISGMAVFVPPGQPATSVSLNYSENAPDLVFDMTVNPQWTGNLEMHELRLKRGDLGQAVINWDTIEWEIDWIAITDDPAFEPSEQDTNVCYDPLPFSLNKVAGQIDTFSPPRGKFFPLQDYSHIYEARSIQAAQWMQKGSLTIVRERRPEGKARIAVDYERFAASGYSFFMNAESICREDELSTPLTWSYSAKMAASAGDPPYLETGVSKTGEVSGGQMRVTTGADVETDAVPARYTHKYNLFDSTQHLSGPETRAVAFTLIDEFDQLRHNQVLEYHDQVQVLVGGIPQTLTAYVNKGEGVIPAVYWVDRYGRLLFMMSGMEIYVLVAETHPSVGAWWDWDVDDEMDGWAGSATVENAAVAGSIMSFDVTGDDPYLLGPVTSFAAATHRYVYVRIRNGTAGTGAQILWANDQGGIAPERSKAFTISASDSEFQTYVLDMSGEPNWTGTITRLRIDPVGNETGPIEIDYIGAAAALDEAPPVFTAARFIEY